MLFHISKQRMDVIAERIARPAMADGDKHVVLGQSMQCAPRRALDGCRKSLVVWPTHLGKRHRLAVPSDYCQQHFLPFAKAVRHADHPRKCSQRTLNAAFRSRCRKISPVDMRTTKTRAGTCQQFEDALGRTTRLRKRVQRRLRWPALPNRVKNADSINASFA